jgi:hypothetical protein
MQLSSSRQQWARFPWERRAPARLQKPRGSVAFPGTPHVDTENDMTLVKGPQGLTGGPEYHTNVGTAIWWGASVCRLRHTYGGEY